LARQRILERRMQLGGDGQMTGLGSRFMTRLSPALLAMGLLAGAGGCAFSVPPESAAIVTEGVGAYVRGDAAGADARMSRFIAMHPSAQEAAEAHYVRGLVRSMNHDSAGARDDFARAAALTRRADLAGRTHLAAALVAEQSGDDASARAGYVKAIEHMPAREGGGDLERALYRLGCLLQRQGEWLEADRYFDRLIYLYGSGRLAAAAGRRIRGTGWTIESGAFSQRGEAADHAAALRRAFGAPRIRPVVRETLLWVVWTGRYDTYAQAAADLAAARRYGPSALAAVAVE